MTAPTNEPEYDPIVPPPDSSVAESQKPLLDNFRTLYDAFVRNHVALDDATNPGNHENIQLVQQHQPLSTESQEIAIYTKEVPGQTDQIFMRYGENGKEFQLTNYQIYDILETSSQKSFISFLPGGVVVNFGTVFSNGSKQLEIVLTPAVTNVISVNLCGMDTIRAQPNVALLNSGGKLTKAILQSVSSIPSQFYLILGNI